MLKHWFSVLKIIQLNVCKTYLIAFLLVRLFNKLVRIINYFTSTVQYIKKDWYPKNNDIGQETYHYLEMLLLKTHPQLYLNIFLSVNIAEFPITYGTLFMTYHKVKLDIFTILRTSQSSHMNAFYVSLHTWDLQQFEYWYFCQGYLTIIYL